MQNTRFTGPLTTRTTYALPECRPAWLVSCRLGSLRGKKNLLDAAQLRDPREQTYKVDKLEMQNPGVVSPQDGGECRNRAQSPAFERWDLFDREIGSAQKLRHGTHWFLAKYSDQPCLAGFPVGVPIPACRFPLLQCGMDRRQKRLQLRLAPSFGCNSFSSGYKFANGRRARFDRIRVHGR